MASTLFSTAQNMTPVTRAEVNEINLRLEGLDKFGKQHRLGNQLILAGAIISAVGSLNYIINNLNTKSSDLSTNISYGMMIGGGAISTSGLIVNLDSFRHLKKHRNTGR